MPRASSATLAVEVRANFALVVVRTVFAAVLSSDRTRVRFSFPPHGALTPGGISLTTNGFATEDTFPVCDLHSRKVMETHLAFVPPCLGSTRNESVSPGCS